MSDPVIFTPQGTPIQTKIRVSSERFVISSDFDLQTGRGQVVIEVPGLKQPLQLLPAEARILGLQLITEAETAILSAVTLRMLLEHFQIPPEHALKFYGDICAGTRQDHVEEYVRFQREKKAQAAMAQGVPDGPAS